MKKGFMTALAFGIMMIILPMAVSAYTDSAITRTTFDNGKYIVDPGTAEDGSVVIFAGYNGDALVYVDYRINNVTDGSEPEFIVPDTVDYDSAKVFVWGSLDNVNPIALPELIKVSKITPETEFAVVDSVVTYLSGEILNVYNSEGFKSFEVSSNLTLPELTHGDVVVLGINSSEQIVEIEKLYTVDNSAASVEAMWSAPKIKNPYTLEDSNHFIQSGIEAWDNTDMSDEEWARVGFGIIVGKWTSSVSIATVRKATEEDIRYISELQVGDNISWDGNGYDSDNIEKFELADDINVYVYDYGQRENRVFKGGRGNIIRTNVPASYKFASPNGADVYKWTDLGDPYYVFYKITNDEITDILVINPAI